MTQNRKSRLCLITLLIGLAIVILLSAPKAYGVEGIPEYGCTETGLHYELYGDSTYMIVYYEGKDPIVHIPAYINDLPVTLVYEAFMENDVIEEVIFPETVTEMDYRCFQDCPNLKTVGLGGLTTVIEENRMPLFWGCPQLETLIFGKGANIKIENMGAVSGYRFNILFNTQWNHLKHIKISNTMTRVPRAFFYGDSLETIEVESGHPEFSSMDGILYSADGKTLLVCGTAYKKEYCVIPEGVTTIDGAGFQKCGNIKTLTIPNSVTSINASVFEATSMTLHVPKGSYGETFAAKEKLDYRRYDESGNLETPVTEITLSQTAAAMDPGGTLQLTATCGPAQADDKSVEWKSDNPGVATVSADGIVTAVGSGSAKITASAPGGCNVTAVCDVTVKGETGNHGSQNQDSSSTLNQSVAGKTDAVAAKAKKPKTVTLKKVSSTKKGTLKLTWKKDTKATGYQAIVATDKKFKKNKKTATLKKNKTVSKIFTKLKRQKTYFAKVRAYKQVGKTKVYGAYSKVKNGRVK